MHKFWLERIKGKNLFIFIGISILLICLQFFSGAWKTMQFVNSDTIDITPYTQWLGSSIETNMGMLFYFVLPLLASLGGATIYNEDKKQGYFYLIYSKITIKRYFTTLITIVFCLSFLITSLVLILNLILNFMVLPAYNPVEALDVGLNFTYGNTLFPSFYYSHPLVYTGMYIILSALFSGLFAIVTLTISLYVEKFFVVVSSVFLVQLVLMVIGFMTNIAISPAHFLMERGDIASVSFVYILLFYILSLVATLVFYVIGVKKNVIK
ncbi:hypothetical protein [Listeria grandensis]|uniref:hypothetical protein n=1 Tax=Listeria grandensis TaxID=1494963 RepID=UPI00164DBB3A|nr:hypothetical protein [Listeria grandensis]MBC6316000.1 hypothetical protein [Listeria grandensis]